MDDKKGSFKPVVIALLISFLIAIFWNSMGFIRNSVHAILDPSAGALLNWNLHWGMIVIILILSIITTLAQKYTTDQEGLKKIREEQKALQEEMKKHKDNPQKVMELQKKSFEYVPQTFKLSMGGMVYTAIPLILFFRWFMDYFAAVGSPKFFGFMGWVVFYLIGSIIFSSILRKTFKVV
jgi:uncharacterized membrane protein (DUF106 family)